VRDALNEVLDHPRTRQNACSRDIEPESVNRAMDVYLRFVNGVVHEGIHRSFPRIAQVCSSLSPAVNALVLARKCGATVFPFAGGCGLIYFLVWLPRHHPIAPKKPEEAAGIALKPLSVVS